MKREECTLIANQAVTFQSYPLFIGGITNNVHVRMFATFQGYGALKLPWRRLPFLNVGTFERGSSHNTDQRESLCENFHESWPSGPPYMLYELISKFSTSGFPYSLTDYPQLLFCMGAHSWEAIACSGYGCLQYVFIQCLFTVGASFPEWYGIPLATVSNEFLWNGAFLQDWEGGQILVLLLTGFIP